MPLQGQSWPVICGPSVVGHRSEAVPNQAAETAAKDYHSKWQSLFDRLVGARKELCRRFQAKSDHGGTRFGSQVAPL